MYSDRIENGRPKVEMVEAKKRGITPLQQLHKLVTSAAKFDKEMDEKIVEKGKPFRRKRISLDKTLLHNHLRHTSAHNRLKEENEMWEMHGKIKQQKKEPLVTRRKASGFGSMYSDREPGSTKITKVPTIRENTVARGRNDFGKYTKKLLEIKEKDDNKWGHGGFKEIYADELQTSKRKIIPRKRAAVKINSTESSSELSDSDDEPGFGNKNRKRKSDGDIKKKVSLKRKKLKLKSKPSKSSKRKVKKKRAATPESISSDLSLSHSSSSSSSISSTSSSDGEWQEK